jgi:hypothetical protein
VNETIRMRSRRKLHPKTIRRLRFEPLESRLLLAQAVLGAHHFREDDFSLSGTYDYDVLGPEEQESYRDEMHNANYSSSAAHVTWTSPDQGTGSFVGAAGGSGYSWFYYNGKWRACSSYTHEEEGRFDFNIEASQSLLSITNSVATSTGYSAYTNTSSGTIFSTDGCNQPNPAPARFFSGAFDGIFDPANHSVAVEYEEVFSDPDTGTNTTVTVDSPSAMIDWTGQAATDFVLNLLPYQRDITLPEGWSAVDQTSSSPPLDVIDVADGGLKFTVDVTGMPAKTSTVLEPVATVRLFWATSDTDTGGAEIPLTSSEPVGVYWNSSQLEVTIEDFPERPPDATHVRVLIQPEDGIPDADLSNDSQYLQIVDFQALDSPKTSPRTISSMVSPVPCCTPAMLPIRTSGSLATTRNPNSDSMCRSSMTTDALCTILERCPASRRWPTARRLRTKSTSGRSSIRWSLTWRHTRSP